MLLYDILRVIQTERESTNLSNSSTSKLGSVEQCQNVLVRSLSETRNHLTVRVYSHLVSTHAFTFSKIIEAMVVPIDTVVKFGSKVPFTLSS